MPCFERLARAIGAALLVGACLSPCAVMADEPSSAPDATRRHPVTPHLKIDRPTGSTSTSSSPGGWWIGTAGVALALAAFGGISVASRRFTPKSEAGALRVVGRTSLSPRHTVYLLKAGDRVLIVGTGPQGSPTLLGEMASGGGA